MAEGPSSYGRYLFELHEQLKADTVIITRLKLSLLLMLNDRSVPWLILVPERDGVRELHELAREDRRQLTEEVVLASRAIQNLYNPDKLNIGSLGNLVPQLHVHVIGRYKTDRAWPGPIWGTGPRRPYSPDEAAMACKRLKEAIERII